MFIYEIKFYYYFFFSLSPTDNIYVRIIMRLALFHLTHSFSETVAKTKKIFPGYE